MVDTKILIPGGELTLSPAGHFIGKDNQSHPKGAAVGISFGKKFVSLRIDQIAVLYRQLTENDEVRKFVGIDA